MEALPLEGRLPIVLSIAQFRSVNFDFIPNASLTWGLRPEKDHAKQIRSVAKLLHDHPELVREPNAIRLVLVGGARNASDVARVDSLRALVHDLGIEVCLAND
jgi:glycosyltransferase involved in cell wall biosynthesis